MALRLVMMGTGSFALPTLLSLYDSPHHVVGLVTQPDRTGRGHHHHVNPMKQAAEEQDTPVFQPAKANAAESLDRLREYEADLFVVAAYGQILSAELLSIPRLGAVNVHASLLPRHRGAAPINYAILKGDTETGVTLFQIEPSLDAGPMLGRVSTPIGAKETAGQLEDRLSSLAVSAIRDVIDKLESGTAEALPQDDTLVSKSPRMKKEMGQIDWSQPSAVVERHIRAMQPWPKPYTFLHQPSRPPLRTLILDVDPVATSGDDVAARNEDMPPGAVLAVDDSTLHIRTGDGAVRVLRLQPSGKRAMDVADFLRGHAIHQGDTFGPESVSLK